MSYAKKSELLASTFGSKANKKYASNIVANSVRMDMVDIDHTTSVEPENRGNPDDNDYYTSLPDLPPYNYKTTNPQEIYNFDVYLFVFIYLDYFPQINS